uniref:Uncharacterized protein n=1 Tax=Ascaris lumbricoides TaxID=6252 RepID=A0A0M3HNZ4_ASCLU
MSSIISQEDIFNEEDSKKYPQQFVTPAAFVGDLQLPGMRSHHNADLALICTSHTHAYMHIAQMMSSTSNTIVNIESVKPENWLLQNDWTEKSEGITEKEMEKNSGRMHRIYHTYSVNGWDDGLRKQRRIISRNKSVEKYSFIAA